MKSLKSQKILDRIATLTWEHWAKTKTSEVPPEVAEVLRCYPRLVRQFLVKVNRGASGQARLDERAKARRIDELERQKRVKENGPYPVSTIKKRTPMFFGGKMDYVEPYRG